MQIYMAIVILIAAMAIFAFANSLGQSRSSNH
jgi:hypothetical protein